MASCEGVSCAEVERKVRAGIGIILDIECNPDLDGLENVALQAAQRCGAQNVKSSIRCSGGVHHVQIEFGDSDSRKKLEFLVIKADAA